MGIMAVRQWCGCRREISARSCRMARWCRSPGLRYLPLIQERYPVFKKEYKEVKATEPGSQRVFGRGICRWILSVYIGDVHWYPVVPVEMKYKDRKHRIEAAASSQTLALFLGIDWPGFNKLMGQCMEVCWRQTGKYGICAACGGDTRLSILWRGKRNL